MIKQKSKLGDCIIVACNNVIDNKDLLFCYAYVMGQKHLVGQRILHAWNELGDLVFDDSNGKEITMRKEKYYIIAKIKEKDVTRQKAEEVMSLMLKTKKYGGWIK